MLIFGIMLLCSFETKGETICNMIGKPEYPLLSNDGDIIIGGAFSIHSKINLEIPSFTEKPQHLMCTRFVASLLLFYNTNVPAYFLSNLLYFVKCNINYFFLICF